jgi:hypothetical protein
MKSKRLVLIGVGAVALIVMLISGNSDSSTYWSDKMIPAVQIRCLSIVGETETSLGAQQKFCSCVGEQFKRSWRSDPDFLKILRPAVSGYIQSEDTMKSKDRNQSTLLVEAELSPFYRDIYLRLNFKWGGKRFEGYQKSIENAVEPLFERAERNCVERSQPKSPAH